MKNTEEKWLSERYGAEYESYRCRVNRCIPGISDKDALYESGITGTVTAVVMLICAAVTGIGELLYGWLMLAGGILCGVFAWLLLSRYKRK